MSSKKTTTKLFILLSILFCRFLLPKAETIKIGMSLGNGSNSSEDLRKQELQSKYVLQFFVERATQKALQITNATTPLTFEAVLLEDFGDPKILLENHDKLYDSGVRFFLAAKGLNLSLLGTLEQWANEKAPGDVLMFTFDISYHNEAQNKNVVSIVPHLDHYISTLYPQFRINKVKKLAVVYPDGGFGSFFRPALDTAIDYAPLNGFEAPTVYNYHLNLTHYDVAIQTITQIALEVIKNKEKTIVLVGGYENHEAHFLRVLKAKNYSPDFIAVLPFFEAFRGKEYEDISEFVVGVGSLAYTPKYGDTAPRYPPEDFYGSLKQFEWDYLNISYTHEIISQTILTAAGMSLLYKAIEFSRSTEVGVVADTIFLHNFDTIAGRYRYDVSGNCLLEPTVLQLQKGRAEVIAPVIAQTHQLVFPFVKWTDRFYEDDIMDEPYEIGIFTVVIFCCFVSLFWIVYVIMYWNHSVIKGGSPAFLIVMASGSIFLYLSIVCFLPELVSDFTCTAKVWCLGMGYILTFGALFAKSWRIYALFHNQTLELITVPDVDVWKVIGVLVLIEVILLIIFTFVGDTDASITVVDDFRPSKDLHGCSVSVGYWITLGLLFLYKLVVSIWGIYLSIRLRKVQYKVFNESKPIAFAQYNLVFFAMLAVVLQSVDLSIEVEFIITSVLIILGTLITVNSLFLRKLYMICTGISSFAKKSSSGNTASRGGRLHATTTQKSSAKSTVGGGTINDSDFENMKKRMQRYKEKYRKAKQSCKYWKERFSEISDNPEEVNSSTSSGTDISGEK